MRRRAAAVAAVSLAALAGGGACRPRPDPEALFVQAEALRAKYEENACRQAIARYQAAQEEWKRRGVGNRATRAAQGLGRSYEQLGAVPESLQAYRAALALAEGSGERLLESEIRSDVGLAQALAAERDEDLADAEQHCHRALTTAVEAGGAPQEAKALSCLGEVQYHRGNLEDALELYGRARRAWERLQDPRGQAEALLFEGYVFSDLSELEEARARFGQASSLWAALGDGRGQAITLVAEARLHQRRGENQQALNRFDEALTFLRPMGEAVWQAACLTGKAAVYEDMGETRSALESWEEALRLFEKARLANYAIDVLMSLGETSLASGDDGTALGRFERVLVLADRMGNRRWQASALRGIGVVHLVRREPTLALPYAERSLQAQASLGDRKLEGRTRADVGDARYLLGEAAAAKRDFEEASRLARVAGDRVGEARSLFGLARAAVGLGDAEAARGYVERALRIVESLRTDVESRDLRASYLASVHRYHELHVDVLMRLHRARPQQGLAAAAFEASERGRARSLLDSLAEAGVDLRAGLDPDLLEREQTARRAFDDWAERRRHEEGTAAGGSGRDALAREFRDMERRYDQLQAEIRSRSPRYAALAQPQPLRLRDVQKEVLDGGTLLLEYALGDDRSFLWAVSQRAQTSYELPARVEIERQARRVHERLTARLSLGGRAPNRRRQVEQADAEYWTEAARLGDMLLGPVRGRMAGKRVLVVADGALQYVPFAALPVPGRSGPVPMIVEHEIVSLPSAAVLALLRRETIGRKLPAKAVAVLADPVFEADDPRLRTAGGGAARRGADASRAGRPGYPRLAATRQEADAIVAMAPRGMALRAVDFQASRATAASPELAQYRIVHFATHGVFDDETPGLSGVILSLFGERGEAQDGVLRLHDIYGLHLPVELVVLSACNTALGRPVRGEGLVGIVRGFMYAGAKRVVASLWKVDDDATGEMMRLFYRGMLEEGLSPAAALRRAQVGLWRQERWRPPYYWAAFVLQGEWR